MAIDRDRINARSDLSITVGVFILALAVAIMVDVFTKEIDLVGAIGIVLVILGAFLLIRSSLAGGAESGFGPSSKAYLIVWGTLMVTSGLILIVYALAVIDPWILVAIMLVAIALLAIMLGILRKKEMK